MAVPQEAMDKKKQQKEVSEKGKENEWQLQGRGEMIKKKDELEKKKKSRKKLVMNIESEGEKGEREKEYATNIHWPNRE